VIHLPDVSLRFRYSPKDARWRWLVEIEEDSLAGEERYFLLAAEKAALAAERLVRL
jgi:hypothetical protein